MVELSITVLQFWVDFGAGFVQAIVRKILRELLDSSKAIFLKFFLPCVITTEEQDKKALAF